MTAAHPLVDAASVRYAVRRALRALWSERPDLVAEGAHERAVVAQLARRLAPLAAVWDRRWEVDVEYDRWHRDGLKIVREKFLANPETGRDGRVYPDLIVHHPGHDGAEHNLLVLEAKRGRVRISDRADDYRKLDGFLTVFGYQQAVFLEFDGRGGFPRLQWITPAGPRPDPALPAAEVVAT